MLRYLQWRERKEKEEYENAQRREWERQHEVALALESVNVNKEIDND